MAAEEGGAVRELVEVGVEVLEGVEEKVLVEVGGTEVLVRVEVAV